MGRVKLLNTQVDNISISEAIDEIDRLLQTKRCSFVVTPNVDHIVRLENDAELQSVYRDADLVLTDGQPLVWLSRLTKYPIRERVSGSDLFPRLCDLAQAKGYTMFLLGAAEGVASTAASNLCDKYENLKVVGTLSPPFGFEKDPDGVASVVDAVRASSPDILVVGLGCPKQEKFIYHNIQRMSVGIALGLGASIDFEAGTVKRAPLSLRRCGLEWLYRLVCEPRRLARRYLVDDMKILPIAVKHLGEA